MKDKLQSMAELSGYVAWFTLILFCIFYFVEDPFCDSVNTFREKSPFGNHEVRVMSSDCGGSTSKYNSALFVDDEEIISFEGELSDENISFRWDSKGVLIIQVDNYNKVLSYKKRNFYGGGFLVKFQ